MNALPKPNRIINIVVDPYLKLIDAQEQICLETTHYTISYQISMNPKFWKPSSIAEKE
jgi:hypothetical protein